MTFMLESRWTRVMPAVAQKMDMSAGIHKRLSGLPPGTQSRCQLEAALKLQKQEGRHLCSALLCSYPEGGSHLSLSCPHREPGQLHPLPCPLGPQVGTRPYNDEPWLSK